MENINERLSAEPKLLNKPLFNKDNMAFMLLGVGLIAIGMMLMAGGKSDANKFNPEEVYSNTRIVIAPILITVGLIVEIYGIMKKPKRK